MVDAIRAALAEAGATVDDVDLISLSAFAAPSYDRMYANVLREVFGERAGDVRRVTWEPVVGHVLAVAAAHDRAISRYDHDTAVRSQYPMLGVMIGYTVVGLLLLLGA